MKTTSAAASKALKKLQNERDALMMKETLTKEFCASLGEDAESVRPQYDYEATQSELEAIEKKIRKLKHSINIFNTTNLVPGFDMTVDEMLVYIPQLSAKVTKLNAMRGKLPKMRVDARMARNANIIDYTYLNYDLDKVNEDYLEAVDELSRAQTSLDGLNNSVLYDFEIQ